MSVLGFVAVILVSTALGAALLLRAYGMRSALVIVVLSQGMNLVATAYRFRSEISHVQYTDVSPDSFRYLEGGRRRWLEEAAPLSGIDLEDGTNNTFVIGQWFFSALGDDPALIFLAGSTCGLVGLWLMALALRTVRPDAPVLFGYLVCLTPSVAFWSSSFGKDAFTFLAVGAALWVVADQAVRRRVRAVHVLTFLLADGLMLLVRVDIGLVLLAAVLVSAYGVRSGPGPLFRRGLIGTVFLGLPVLLLGATLLQLRDPFGIVEEFSGSYDRTSIGGSAIGGGRPDGILGLVTGGVTAVFRPFPWEFGFGGLISSLDVVVFAAVVVVLVREMRRGHLWRLEDARVTVFGSLVVIAVFSQLTQLANLGLLVRLRSLIIPVLIVIVAVLIVPAVTARAPSPSGRHRRQQSAVSSGTR